MADDEEPAGGTPAAAEEPKPEEPKLEEPKLEEPGAEEPKLEEPAAEEPKLEEPAAKQPEHGEQGPEEDKPGPIPLAAAAWELAADVGVPAEVARERLEHVGAAIARRCGIPVAAALRGLTALPREFLAVLCARSDDEAARAAVDVCKMEFPGDE